MSTLLESRFHVEVIGRYSNPLEALTPTPLHICDLGESDRGNAERGQTSTPVVTQKQHQTRLRSGQVDELVAAYRSGVAVDELAKRYGICRQTVSGIMRRKAVPNRQPKLDDKAVSMAAERYRSGASLMMLAADLGVSATTVGRALVEAGVSLRPRRGWQY